MSRKKNGQFTPGTTGNPKGRPKKDKAAVARLDDWRNRLTGLGVPGRDKRIGTEFALYTLTFDQLRDLWLGDDLAARAVETIPFNALREGYDLVISNANDPNMSADEIRSEVTNKLQLLGIDQYLSVCGSYERGFGGGALLLGVNDGQDDLTVPLNLNKVRSFDWVTPLEARELMPLYAYADPRAPKYGQPEIYQLMSRAVLPSYNGNYYSNTMLIHESRLIPFPGIRVSRYQVTTARGGWGESVLTRVWRVLRDFNNAWAAAGVLVTDFAQSVIKIQGLWEAIALDGGGAFQNRLDAMERGRSVTNAVTIDANDSYERQQTPLAGLPDLLEKFAVRLAAACDMPLTLLFGTSPAGMNATGESDIRLYYDRVAAYQQQTMEPALRRICQIIFRTLGNRVEPNRWSIKFRPLWQENAKDKAAALFTQAQADNVWITAGVLSPEEVAAAHWGSGEYNPNLSIDFNAREAQEQAAAPPVTTADINALNPDYVPPPPVGSAAAPEMVPAPAKPAAPDTNTSPVSPVTAGRADAPENAVADMVYNQLEPDFPDSSLDWVQSTVWKGPMAVPLNEIDYSNAASWQAVHEVDKIDKFEKRIRNGWMKPIILIKRPGNPLLMIADGHHRALAYQNLDQSAMAYIGYVDTDEGPWDEFHDTQYEGNQDEWSDAAREAAAEARKAGAKATPENVKPAESKKIEHGGHGEGGQKSEQKHPAGSEGKQGGKAGEKSTGKPKEGGGKERGEKGEGKGHSEGKEHESHFGSKLAEIAKSAGEVVAGEKASEVAGQLSGSVGVKSGEGEGGEE